MPKVRPEKKNIRNSIGRLTEKEKRREKMSKVRPEKKKKTRNSIGRLTMNASFDTLVKLYILSEIVRNFS